MSAAFRAPFTQPGVWPELRPGRFASTLRPSPEGCRCALLGLADDLGVKLNGGRPGARGGPNAFRAALARYGVPWDGERRRALELSVYDAGDITPAAGDGEASLLETHDRVERAVSALRERGLVMLCVGGGHDLSLPAIAAASASLGCALGGVNLDAHLDVREKVGSGMPFRRLIEDGRLDARRFVELGLGRFVNDPQDLEWLRARGGTAVHADAIFERGLDAQAALELAAAEGPAFVSIDLDVLDQSIAPGVSAPNPLGLSLREAAKLAEAAGARREIQHFDVMEFNPSYDVDGHTGRAAALLLLHFVAGFSQRAA
jgi:formimidoylglutamase